MVTIPGIPSPGPQPPQGAAIPGIPSGPGRAPYSTHTLNRFAAGRPEPEPEPMVLVGHTPGPSLNYRDPGERSGSDDDDIRKRRTQEPRHLSANILLGQFNDSSMDDKREMARLLALAGYLDLSSAENPKDALRNTLNSATLDDVMQAYGALVMETAARNQVGQVVTPDDVLMMNIEFRHGKFDGLSNAWESVVGGDGDGEGLGIEEDLSGTTTQTVRQRDIWNPQQAKQLIKAKLQEVLQRDPTKAEYEDFVASLRDEQRENPVVTRVTQTTNRRGEVVDQSQTSRGGIDPNAEAQEFIEDAPDYGDWQMMGTYFPAVMDALGSAVPGT